MSHASEPSFLYFHRLFGLVRGAGSGAAFPHLHPVKQKAAAAGDCSDVGADATTFGVQGNI
jgi:hypothetical protein